MNITLYACKGIDEEITKETRSFVTEWQAVRYGKSQYFNRGKDFVLISSKHKGEGWKQFFYGIPFWIEGFLRGF